ncbi:MAG: hypothetical protein EA370_09055 [Wenzhouxiangella sp.]|nr:MAG: hypothetical protein EA370_09055 [Wenzhouxiangella sp.]
MTVKRMILPGLLAGAALIAISACDRSPSDPDDQVLATVADQQVTVGEFRQELEERNRRRPGYFNSAERRAELLDEMIRWRALLAEARAAGVMDDPEFRRLVERMTVQKLRQDRMREEMASDRIEREEIERYYEANLAEFSRPERRQVALIRINRPGEASGAEQARIRAEQARYAALELPEDVAHFGAVAVDYSDDRSSRYQGGVIGWLVDTPERRYRWDEAVLEAAFALETPGEISPVITSQSGYHIVRLVQLEPGSAQPLEQVADGIRHRLTRARTQDFESELIDHIRQAHPARIDEALLAQIEPPATIPPERERDPESRRPPPMPIDDADAPRQESDR